MRPKFLVAFFISIAAGGCVEEPTSPELEVAVAALLSTNRLQIGEAITARGALAQAVIVDGGGAGAEYLLVPFNASDAAATTLAVEVTGGNVLPPTELAPAATRAEIRLPPSDQEFHLLLREREIEALSHRLPLTRRDPPSFRPQIGRAVPAVGDLLTINASLAACDAPRLRTGRVAAVTDRAIVVEDVANPTGGFTDAEYELVGEVFDTLIYPVATENFGSPSDIDENQRSIIFYTRVVNELTERGSESQVGGFHFSRDLFPLEDCETSNVAEIFYMLAPDPTGEVNDNRRPKDQVFRRTLGTIAHEFQHLINASRRIYVNDAAGFEEVWLNEGLSHIAEELVFYAATDLAPRQNIALPTVQANQTILRALITYQLSNLDRYATYLEDPDEESLLGVDNLPTRGASWAFLRYAADQDDGPDQPLWFALVNSTQAGISNLAVALDAPPIDLMQTWTASVFTDDLVPVQSELYLQPSWNFRSILPALEESGEFPLETIPLTETATTFTLKGGGAVFLRFGVPPGQRATVMVSSGGELPPERLRVTAVRVR